MSVIKGYFYMKKILCIILCVLILGAFSACSAVEAEIILITDAAGLEEDARSAGLWEGIQLYADIHGKTANYILPSGSTQENYNQAIEKAVDNGASLVVLSGESFAFATEMLDEQYPNTSFVLMDAGEVENSPDNLFSLQLSEEEAGYMAGYMAVLDGLQSLGFMGLAQDEKSFGYGFGFVQGAAAAAEELDIQVDMHYAYTAQDKESANEAAHAWFAQGVQLIFACESTIAQGVFDAAEELGGVCMGADIDMASFSPTVQVSAVKYWQSAMGHALDLFYQGDLFILESETVGVAENAVGLSMESARFETATLQDYEQLRQRFLEEEIAVVQADRHEYPQHVLEFTENLQMNEA